MSSEGFSAELYSSDFSDVGDSSETHRTDIGRYPTISSDRRRHNFAFFRDVISYDSRTVTLRSPADTRSMIGDGAPTSYDVRR